jgi:hypothetical protein
MTDGKLAEMKKFHQEVSPFKRPEQLFGELPGNTSEERLDELKKEYTRFLYLYHPEANKEESKELLDVAGKITNIVIYLYSLAEKRIMLGTYGQSDPESSINPFFDPLVTRSHEYIISRFLAEGENSRVYAARMDEASEELWTVQNRAKEAKS